MNLGGLCVGPARPPSTVRNMPKTVLVDNIVTCSKGDLQRDERFRQLAAETWRATLRLPPSTWELLRGPAVDDPDGGVANQMWLGRRDRSSSGDGVNGIVGDPEMLWLLVLHNLRWTQETPAIRFTQALYANIGSVRPAGR